MTTFAAHITSLDLRELPKKDKEEYLKRLAKYQYMPVKVKLRSLVVIEQDTIGHYLAGYEVEIRLVDLIRMV